jgi:putative SOS response-associated peptidase YedK
MCGRMVLFRLAKYTDLFPWIRVMEEWPARFNLAPTQDVACVLDAGGVVQRMRWGLVPSWAKDVAIGSRLINARSETVKEKPAFRAAIKRRRCLILADGFYEWKGSAGAKVPMYIRFKNDRPMGMAGIWESWQDDRGNELRTTAVLTCGPNELMREIHDRMPVIVPEERWKEWVEVDERKEVEDFFRSYSADEMIATAVGREVNRVGNEGPGLIEPAREEALPETMGERAGAIPKRVKNSKPKTNTQPGLFD